MTGCMQRHRGLFMHNNKPKTCAISKFLARSIAKHAPPVEPAAVHAWAAYDCRPNFKAQHRSILDWTNPPADPKSIGVIEWPVALGRFFSIEAPGLHEGHWLRWSKPEQRLRTKQ